MVSKKHMQNEYGLSYNAMIVLAIQNSPAALNHKFCNRGASIQDIYKFLKAHVRPIAEMNQKEWNKTERVIRHSLSQTTYFNRFSISEDGIKIVPSRAAGAEKGSIWTLYPACGETEEKCHKRIFKVFKEENVLKFREHLFNPDIIDALKNGTYGWHGPHGESLGTSDAMKKLQEKGYTPQDPAFVVAPSSMTQQPAPRRAPKRRAESDSDEDSEVDADEDTPRREYTLRPRKKIEKKERPGVQYVEFVDDEDLERIQREAVEAQYASYGQSSVSPSAPFPPQEYYSALPPQSSAQEYQDFDALGYQHFGFEFPSSGLYLPGAEYPQYTQHMPEDYSPKFPNFETQESEISLDPNGIFPTEDEEGLEPNWNFPDSFSQYEEQVPSYGQLL
ncbi:hypothetical protein QR680_007345 [Steinernema hermaphroditum]|uniref:Fork-head domain-containing protein n=1 Tax=Steinernema hermaphroditum TaxID=289476 RepID=A0AA39IEC3_9BILA|nr:hypothetical protein QR680_007345 [Steinernema hermaphroditum]